MSGTSSLSRKTASYTLHLSDTKTRRSKTVPSKEDSTSARLQLMIYWRLLTELLSPTFSWSELWDLLGISPLEALCDDFLEQALLILPGVDQEVLLSKGYSHLPHTLSSLVDVFRNATDELLVRCVHRELEIVYVAQRGPRAREKLRQEAVVFQKKLEQDLMQQEGAVLELAQMIAADAVAEMYPFWRNVVDDGPRVIEEEKIVDHVERPTWSQNGTVLCQTTSGSGNPSVTPFTCSDAGGGTSSTSKIPQGTDRQHMGATHPQLTELSDVRIWCAPSVLRRLMVSRSGTIHSVGKKVRRVGRSDQQDFSRMMVFWMRI